jgi:hypothetical protein
MHILYKVTYLPHLGTKYPKYYIGSKMNYVGNYFGSPSSKKKFKYTCGQSLKDWWKSRDKADFKFEVVKTFPDITTRIELLTEEHNLQLELDITSDEYFNRAYARARFFPKKNSKSRQHRKKISQAKKRWYQTKQGQEFLDRKRFPTEEVRLAKSKQAKERWKNPTPAMLSKVKSSRKVSCNGLIYNSTKEASNVTGIKLSTLQLWVRTNKNGWNYIQNDQNC